MPRIAFVDDDRRILEGLENALFRHRPEWDMEFYTDARSALASIETGNIDVVVADMRMPGMDGAQLLTAVQERQPQVVRIVLSAYAEFEAILRAVPVAHHYLVKPCDAADLWQVVLRAVRLRETLQEKDLHKVVRRVSDLPPAPHRYSELTRILSDPKKGIEDCLRVIAGDVTLTARVIRLASTAALGFHGKVSNLHSAGVFLGTNMLRNLVLSVEAFEAFQGLNTRILEAEQRHATLTGAIAKSLAPSRHLGENACLAGILHDLGAILLASRLPGEQARARIVAQRTKGPDHLAEQQALGTTHAGIGAWMLSTWGLPYPVIEAVACHHAPRTVPHGKLDELGLVHVASALAAEVAGSGSDPMDLEYLEALGMHNDLPELRKVAAGVAATIGTV